MFSARLLVAASMLVQLLAIGASHAYKLEPISRVFAPSGSSATQSFEIINDQADRIALTVSIQTLQRDESYAETNADAEDDFLVYPPQMVLAPGKTQTLRVTWLGDAKPTTERAFRIVVQQVPIEKLIKAEKPATTADGRVRVMLAYRGTLFVRPTGALPRIESEVRTIAAGKQLALTLVNRGTAVGLVKRCSLRLQLASGEHVEVAAADLAQLQNHRVLAGGRRRYTIAWPSGMRSEPVKTIGQCVVEP